MYLLTYSPSIAVQEIDEEKSRSAEIMSRNAQLEMENERSAEEVGVLSSELERLRSKQPVSMPTIISPPRVSESEMYVHVYIHMWVCTYVRTYVHAYIRIYTISCMYVHGECLRIPSQ